MSSVTPCDQIIPHRRYRDFLAPQDHAALLAWTIENQARFKPALIAQRSDEQRRLRSVVPEIRRALCLNDLGPWLPVLRKRFTEILPDLLSALRVAPFAVSYVEVELAAHNDGAHFKRHIDTATVVRAARGDRIFSAVYYFHREPRGFSGGALRLHQLSIMKSDTDVVDIEPEQNSFVAFHSWWPHQVMPVSCPSGDFADSRFAVNFWAYRATPGTSDG